jgi:hypothetical protein
MIIGEIGQEMQTIEELKKAIESKERHLKSLGDDDKNTEYECEHRYQLGVLHGKLERAIEVRNGSDEERWSHIYDGIIREVINRMNKGVAPMQAFENVIKAAKDGTVSVLFEYIAKKS